MAPVFFAFALSSNQNEFLLHRLFKCKFSSAANVEALHIRDVFYNEVLNGALEGPSSATESCQGLSDASAEAHP